MARNQIQDQWEIELETNIYLETLKSSLFKEFRGQTWNVEGVADRVMVVVLDRVIVSLYIHKLNPYPVCCDGSHKWRLWKVIRVR